MNQQFEVKYELDENDLLSFREVFTWTQRLRHYFTLLAVIGLMFAIMAMPLALLTGSGIGVFAVLLPITIALFIWIRWKTNKTWRDVVAKSLYRFKNLTCGLTEDAIEYGSPTGWSRGAWKTVLRIHETGERIYFVLDNETVLIITKRAFATPEACREFVHFANAQWERRDSAGQFTHRIAIPVDTHCAEVRYQNTVDDWTSAETANAFVPTQQSTKSPRTGMFFFSTIFVVMLLVFFLSKGSRSPVLNVLGGGYLTIMILIGLISLIPLIQKRFRSRNLPAGRLSEQIVSVSPDGFTRLTPLTESTAQWTNATEFSVEENENLIAVYTPKPHLGYVIPKRAFGSPTECERFAHLLRHFIDMAKEPLAATEVVNSGNPYRSPAAG